MKTNATRSDFGKILRFVRDELTTIFLTSHSDIFFGRNEGQEEEEEYQSSDWVRNLTQILIERQLI